jgi:hypothetical protein
VEIPIASVVPLLWRDRAPELATPVELREVCAIVF